METKKPYVTGENLFATLEVCFATMEEGPQRSTEPLKSEEIIFMPKHIGRTVTKIKISENIPWQKVSILYDIENSATILEAKKIHEQSWTSHGLEILVHIPHEYPK